MKILPLATAALCAVSLGMDFSSAAAERAPQIAPGVIAKLVAQLDHDDFDKREEAMEKLFSFGERIMPDLQKTLERKSVGPEAENRIRYLLGTLSGPEHGLVWRTLLTPGTNEGGKAVVPVGIQPGDVITEIDGQAIDSDEAAGRFGGRYFQNAPATIWRHGKTIQLNLTMNGETTYCFHPWPDPIRQYELYGHRGKWDETVLKALAIGTLLSKNQCEPLYTQAYSDGCRDAMVIYYWASHLAKLGKLDEAEKIVGTARAEKLVGHPGGKFLYSDLPILHAMIYRIQGKFDEGRKIVVTAEAEAQKNGAFQAIKALKFHLLRSVRYDEHPDPLAFLKNSKDFPYDLLMARDVAAWCQIVSAEGDPGRALELLAFLGPKLQHLDQDQVGQLTEMTQYYQTQNELAKTFKASPEAKRKQVPILLEGGFYTFSAEAGTYMVAPEMPKLKTPGSIDVHMRYWEFPKNYGVWMPFFKLWCGAEAGAHSTAADIGINPVGALALHQYSNDGPAYPDRLVDYLEWGDVFGDKRIRISVEEGRAQISINGRLFRTYYLSGKPPEELKTHISCTSAKSCFYNLMLYVQTDRDVDTKAVEDAWYAWKEAGKSGDRTKIEPAGAQLVTLLRPFPEAKDSVAFVETVLQNSKTLYQPDGWRLDPQTTMKDPQTVAVGLWDTAGDWLVGMNRPDWRPAQRLVCQVPLLLPPNFEVTGQVAAGGTMCPHLAFVLAWNNNLKHSPVGTPFTRPHVFLPWTSPQNPETEKQTPAQTQAAKEFVVRMKKERTFSFCLRKVGQKAVLFVNGVKEPLLCVELPKDVGEGQYLCFHQHCPHETFMFRDIQARAIDPGTDLNAPVQLPEVKPLPTKAQLKNLEDRAAKIRAEMPEGNRPKENKPKGNKKKK